MRLVDDDGEAVAGQLADLVGDHRELLQRGDDDLLAGLERLLELPRGRVDVLDQTGRLLEAARIGLLELAVEHAAVGDHDDRVEDAVVLGVVQRRQPVRQPGDGVALAGAGRVLDEVVLPGALGPSVVDEVAHRLELVEAREDELLLAGRAGPCRPRRRRRARSSARGRAPSRVTRRTPTGRRSRSRSGRRDRRVAGAAVVALVEGQEDASSALELGRHVGEVGVDREVGEHATGPKQRLVGITVEAVLADRVLDGLAVQLVLELGGEDRQAVQEEDDVDASCCCARSSGADARPRRRWPRRAWRSRRSGRSPADRRRVRTCSRSP